MKKSRYGAAFIILAALLFLFLVLNICIGSVNIPVSEIPKMLWGNGADETFTDIVMGIRFPIAGPFTLVISSGAKLVVALVMVASLGNALHLSSWVMIMAAFVGSMICMGFVILMSKVTDQMSMLIVSGVMIGYICSAITDFVVTFADDADIVNLHNWSKGSFSGITWDNDVKADQCLSDGRILCPEYGTECTAVSHTARAVIQYSVSLCDSLCRTGILCRNCCSASG